MTYKGLCCYFYSCLREEKKGLLLGHRVCKFVTHSDVNKSVCQRQTIQQAKGASEAPWVRKIHNPTSRKNFMTSPCECPSLVHTHREEEGRLNEKKTFSIYNAYYDFPAVFNNIYRFICLLS